MKRRAGSLGLILLSVAGNSGKSRLWWRLPAAPGSGRGAFGFVGGAINLKEMLGKVSEYVPHAVQKIVGGLLSVASATVIALLLLFFFLRDREEMLGAVRGLLPLSREEDAIMFKRVGDTIHAVLYGTFAVALLQGTLGGLMFWWLGLPAPVLWGCAMAALAIVPMIGTAIVWGPAALYLLLEGEPGARS